MNGSLSGELRHEEARSASAVAMACSCHADEARPLVDSFPVVSVNEPWDYSCAVSSAAP